MKHVTNKLFKVLLSVIMCFSVLHLPNLGVEEVHAAAGDTPAHTKTITDNKDGTYTLSLSVTGDAEKKPQKVNVIVIVDRSGSMSDRVPGTGEITYTESDDYGDPRYGFVDGEYVLLERESYWDWGWHTYYSYNGEEYTGTRYIRIDGNQTRLEATQDAVNSLANTLLGYNGTDGNPDDTVEMSLVTFATSAQTNINETTSASTYTSTVDGLTVATGRAAGTNWEAALQQAATVDFGDDDPTYVIFFSDGAPTFYGNTSGTGQEEEPNMGNSYNAATDDAIALAEKVGVDNFFTIFAYGKDYGATYMSDLTEVAGAPAENNYSASDSVALQQAFAAILAKIEMSGIANVEITDGTTSNVSTTTAYSHLLEVNENSYKYYRSGGSYGSAPGQEWTDAPKAKLVDGAVEWDLSSEEVLENGVTYTVTFEVYPSQTTLDLIADLKNGDKDYEKDLDDEVRKYLIKDGNNYTLLTNTTTNLSYDDTRDDAPQQNIPFNEVSPANTNTSQMLALSKKWVNTLDTRPQTQVTLDVMRDTAVAHKSTLNAGNNFSDEVYISIGILTDVVDREGNHTVTVKAPGHDYSFKELGSDVYNWGMKSPTVHPMLIGQTVTLLELCGPDEEHSVPSGIGSNAYYEEGGRVYYQLGGKVYTVTSTASSEAGLTATNYRRSHLYVYKNVDGDAPADTLYTYNMTVSNPDGSDVWFSVKKTSDPSANDYVVNDEENTYISAPGLVERTGTDGNPTGYYYVPSGTTITVKVQEGWSFGFTNIPVGFEYNLTEVDDGDGDGTAYYFISITGSKRHRESLNSEWIDETITSDGGATINGNNITGSITEDNHEYVINVNNEYALRDIKVTKVWSDADNQDGIRPTSVDVTLNGYEGTKEQPATVTLNETNKWTYTWKNVPKFDADHKEIAYTVSETETKVITGEDKTGTYAYEVTGNMVDGFTVKNTHTPATKDVTVTKVWDDKDFFDTTVTPNPAYTRPTTITLTLQGTDGSNIPRTVTSITEGYTQTYTFEDVPEYVKGKVGERVVYTVSEGELADYTTQIDQSKLEITNTPKKVTTYDPLKLVVKKVDANTKNIISDAVFTLYDSDNTAVKTYKVGASGIVEVIFDEDDTTLPGIGTYTLKETTAPEGYQLNKTVWKVVVEDGGVKSVTKNAQGVWEWLHDLVFGAETNYNKENNTLTVENTPTPTEITVTKVWDDSSNANNTRPEKVTYQLWKSVNGTRSAVSGETRELSGTGDTWTIKFENLPAYEDNYKVTYFIRELNGEESLENGKLLPGLNGSNYVVTYSNNDLTATNKMNPVTASFSVTKVMDIRNGNGPTTWSYNITVTANGSAPVAGTMTGSVTKDNPSVEFGPFTYTAKGIYTYTVSETGTIEGVTNDAEAAGKTVTVTVVANDNGTLTASVDKATIEFKNTYDVKPVKVSFPVKKVLKAAEGLNVPDITGKYTIEVKAANGTPLPATKSYTNPDKDGGTVTFTDIEFTAPGTYTYTVSETGTVAGVTNDAEAAGKTVTVKISDDGKGNLKVDEVSSTTDNPLTFTNTYSVGSAKVSFPVKKVLEAAEGLNVPDITGKYTIKVEAEEGTPLPETTSYTNPEKAGGTVTFGEIEYTKPGTYKYKVSETGTVAGVTNDKDAAGKIVTVKVVDNGDGTLTATADSTTATPLTFTNKYEVSPITASFPVKKVLEAAEGLNAPDITGKYTIKVEAEEGTPLPETTSYTNPAKDGGTVTFGEIEYTKPGTYKYTVSETGEVKGITNDKDAVGKTVTVVIEDDGAGKLVVKSVSSTTDSPVTFTNTYSVGSTTASFPVKKVLDVPKGLEGPAEWKYTITVEAQNGAPAAETMTGTVSNETDTVTFGNFTYTVPGEYKYKVSETGTVAGVTNDKDAAGKIVTVKVVDNGDGTLTATADSTTATPLTFTNTYSVKPQEVTPAFNKVVEKMMPNVESATFKFTLEAGEGSPALTKTESAVTVSKAGTFAIDFGKITFTAPGEYKYVLTEDTSVNDPGWTTKGNPVTVTFSVEDNGDGTLTVTASPEPAVITNTFETTTISGEKTWNDADYVGKEGYQRPESITVTLTGTVAGEGDAKTTVATYEKTVTEEDGWKYSFTDLPTTHNGAQITYTLTEEAVTGYNQQIDGYNVTNTPVDKKDVIDPVSLEITKTDINTGNPLKGAIFTVTDSAGETVGSYTTDENGKITIEFKYADTFTMKETAPEGYTADPGTWTIKVTQSGVDKVEYNNPNEGYWNWYYHLILDQMEDYKDGKLTIPNPPKTENIELVKTWDDADDQDGFRPDDVTFYLYKTVNGKDTKVKEVQLTAENADKDDPNSWKITVENMPSYEDGFKVSYHIVEATADGTELKDGGKLDDNYTVKYDSALKATNSHTPETVEVPVQKVWEGDEDFDVRPESIEVKITGTVTVGEKTEEVFSDTQKLTEDGKWTYTWKDLDKRYEGTVIEYKVEEPTVKAGYQSEVKPDEKGGFVITNKFTPITFDPPVVKTVIGDKTEVSDEFTFEFETTNGAPMPEGSEGSKKTITLPADGKPHEFGAVNLTTVGQFKYTIKEVAGEDSHYAYDEKVYELLFDVDVNTENELICQLTVTVDGEETIIPWETLKAFTFDFVNEYRDFVDVKVIKVWEDNNNSEGNRPESVEVTLYANDEKVESVKLSEENKWTYTWEGLEYSDEEYKEIKYTVKEDNVPAGYEMKSSQKENVVTITNTLKVPDTGDHNDLDKWTRLMAMSLSSSVVLVAVLLKKRRDESEMYY